MAMKTNKFWKINIPTKNYDQTHSGMRNVHQIANAQQYWLNIIIITQENISITCQCRWELIKKWEWRFQEPMKLQIKPLFYPSSLCRFSNYIYIYVSDILDYCNSVIVQKEKYLLVVTQQKKEKKKLNKKNFCQILIKLLELSTIHRIILLSVESSYFCYFYFYCFWMDEIFTQACRKRPIIILRTRGMDLTWKL